MQLAQVWPQVLIMATGAALVLTGIILVIVQKPPPYGRLPQTNVLTASGLGANFRVTTERPGLSLIVVGAILLCVGFLATLPWKGQAC
jgi:hypothetical protein